MTQSYTAHEAVAGIFGEDFDHEYDRDLGGHLSIQTAPESAESDGSLAFLEVRIQSDPTSEVQRREPTRFRVMFERLREGEA